MGQYKKNALVYSKEQQSALQLLWEGLLGYVAQGTQSGRVENPELVMLVMLVMYCTIRDKEPSVLPPLVPFLNALE